MATAQNAEPTSPQEIVDRLPRFPSRDLDHIPGDYGLPFFGYTFHFLTDFKGYLNKMAETHGPIFRSSVMFQRGIHILGPQANEFVLKDADRIFSNKLAWDPILDKLFPNGLMLRDFDVHRYHRRILQGAFKKQALQSYMIKMNPHIALGIQQWPEDKTFRYFDAIKALLLDVAAEVFLGLDMGTEADKVNQAFVDAVDASLAVLRVDIPGTTWHRGLKGRRYLEQFISGLIKQKRQTESADFFSQICHAQDEDGAMLSDEEIRDHMIFLLFAAHDTTTSTLSSIMYALAKNPEWQEILRQEAEALNTDYLDYDDLAKLEKAGWVFREALRMYPPLPTIPRRAIRETSYKGYRIPKNSLVSVSPLYTHYMPEYWSHPQQFDPERWSDERAEYKKHFYQWIPFGGGHHKCLGLNFAEIQSKLFMFHFFKQYKTSVKPGYEMDYQLVPLAMPKDGLQLQIHKR